MRHLLVLVALAVASACTGPAFAPDATPSPTKAVRWIAPKTCPDLTDLAMTPHDNSDTPAVMQEHLDCRYSGADGSELSLVVFFRSAAYFRAATERDAQGQKDFVVRDAPRFGPDAFTYDAYGSTCAIVAQTTSGAIEVNLSDPDHARQCGKTVAGILTDAVTRAT